MEQQDESEDELIISSTFGELAFFLVFVFALAAALLGNGLNAATQTQQQREHEWDLIGEFLLYSYHPVPDSEPILPSPGPGPIPMDLVQRIRNKLQQQPVSCLYEPKSIRSRHPDSLNPNRTILPESVTAPGDLGQVPVFEHADYRPDPRTILHMRWIAGSTDVQIALNVDPSAPTGTQNFVFLDEDALAYFNGVARPLLASLGWPPPPSPGGKAWVSLPLDQALTILTQIANSPRQAHPPHCRFAVLVTNMAEIKRQAGIGNELVSDIYAKLNKMNGAAVALLEPRA